MSNFKQFLSFIFITKNVNNTGNSNKKDSDLSFSPEIPVAVGKQLYYDCFGSNFMTFTLPRKRDNCLVCGHITTNNHTNTFVSFFMLFSLEFFNSFILNI